MKMAKLLALSLVFLTLATVSLSKQSSTTTPTVLSPSLASPSPSISTTAVMPTATATSTVVATSTMTASPTTVATSTMTASPTMTPNPSTTTNPIATSTVTTTPAPTASPAPRIDFPFYGGKNGTVCINVEATMKLSVTYTNSANTNKTVTIKDLNINDLGARVDNKSSSCDNSTSLLTLSFQNSSSNYTHFLTFKFEASKDSYNLSFIGVTLNTNDSSLFPNFNVGEIMVNRTEKVFSADFNDSYKCESSKSYHLKNVPADLKKLKLTLKLSDFQAQAFHFKNTSGNFGSAKSCPSDKRSSKIVPIAVGAALAGLVIVVLIAYLIGRLRSRKQSSYEALS